MATHLRLAVVATMLWTAPLAMDALAAHDLYVATDGNDAWSGKLAAPNPAGTDGPCASLARARNAVRAPKSVEVPRAPLTVIIRGGKYFLHEALTFTNDDSGIAEAPSPAVLIRASSRF